MILIKVLSGYKGLGTEGEKKLVCILHCSQVGRQNGAYPSVYSVKQLGIFLLSPWMGCGSTAGLPPALHLPVPTYTPSLREALY